MSGQLPATAVWLVITTLPDEATARTVARALVDRRLAACVNVQAPGWSVYRWKGEVESATEVALMAKVTAAGYPALEAGLRALHPYALPEIVAVPVVAGLPGYLAWVSSEVETSANAVESTREMPPMEPS